MKKIITTALLTGLFAASTFATNSTSLFEKEKSVILKSVKSHVILSPNLFVENEEQILNAKIILKCNSKNELVVEKIETSNADLMQTLFAQLKDLKINTSTINQGEEYSLVINFKFL